MYRNLIKNQTNFKAGYSPRSSLRLLMTQQKELLNKVTLGFDRHILNSLKGYFSQDGLTQIEFIEALLKGIEGFDSEMPQRQLRLVNAIHTMHEDITMGVNERITWEIFSNYLINNVRHVKNKQEIPYTFSKYNIHPSAKFNNPIAKSIYVEQLALIMMCEENSNKVIVFDPIKGIILPQCLQNEPRKLTVQTSVIKKQRGKTLLTTKQLVIPTDVIIMDLFYLEDPKFNVLLCSTSDGNVRGWKLVQNGFEPAMQPQSQNLNIQHNFRSSIYSMAWDNVNEVLYCGSQKGTIYVWPFKTDTEHPLEEGHQSIVNCMSYITKLQILASGDMDGKLILWDIVTDNKKIFKVHNRGILTMALSQDLLLFTAGFDHQICVWNPYISGLAHKINIHGSTVLSLCLNQNYLFSLDAQTQIKITSLKTLEPIFTISPSNQKQKSKGKASYMSLVLNPVRIVCLGHKIQFYDYDQDKNADLSDNIPLFETFYLQNTFKLFACTVERIKIWNVLTGELEETFSGLTGYEISCIVFRPDQHYILIGDTSGYVTMLNMKSCLKIKQLPRQPAAVDNIVFIPAIKQHNLLAIVSGYSIINIYKIIPEGYQLTKSFTMSKNTQITAIIYNESVKQLIIGNNFGSIELYDVENGKMMIGTTSLDLYSNIVFIEALQRGGLTLLIEVCYMGTISVFLKLPEKLERVKISKVYDSQNKSQLFRINAACWNGKSTLFLGDQKGYIVACNMQPIFDQITTTINVNKLKKDCQIIWRVKGHPESILHMRSLKSESLLLTSAYDRKIKIWNENTGQFIDHLRQQPFHNQTATPIFYWRIDQNGKYDIRKQNITEHAVLNTSVIQPAQEDIVFNPSWLFDCLMSYNSSQISNKYWKIKIDFRQKVEQKIKKCQELIRLLLLKRKSTKFQLILKQPSHSTSKHLLSIQATSRASLQKHRRYVSNMSQQLSPHRPSRSRMERIEQQLPQLERVPKLDLVSRAEVSAHKKFRQDIAMIDNELKHQLTKNNANSKTHHSLNKRKSTILSQYQSKEYFSKQYDLDHKKGIINRSKEELSALGRLSQALKNLDGTEKIKKFEIPSKAMMMKKK